MFIQAKNSLLAYRMLKKYDYVQGKLLLVFSS